MGYHIDYSSLDTLYNSVYSQAANWQTALESLSNATTTLAETTEMSGAGADSIRSYMTNVHSTIQALLAQVITLHQYNCLQYKQDYQHNIDTGLYSVIKESELTAIRSSLTTQKQQACNIEDALSYTLRGIKDIFTVSYNDITWVDEAHQSAISFLSDLDESIRTLEDNHHSSDFVNTGDLIAKLTAMIQELKGHSRSYKTDFSPEMLAGSETFRNLYASYLNVSKELEEEAEAIGTAIENENQRIADLQAEYEKRQKEAQAAKWIVTGLCVIGSVVAIAATGGAATPLVVGAISATSSAIIAGTNNLADQYVANGNLNNVDWGSFGSDVAIGAVTGFVTGYVGASVGGAVTSGLSKTATGATLLNSSNAVVRIGTGAVIGSVSEVTSGIVSRGAGTLIATGGDWDTAMDAAFDVQQIAVDATIGGVSGGIGEYGKIKAEAETPDPLVDGPYIKDGKPNGRPGPTGDAKLEFEQAVYDAQVSNSPDGLLHDPHTGEVIDWVPGQPRDGVVDFGHKSGHEYRDYFEQYKNRQITLEELKEIQSNPNNFYLETPSSNRSHAFEAK